MNPDLEKTNINELLIGYCSYIHTFSGRSLEGRLDNAEHLLLWKGDNPLCESHLHFTRSYKYK